ncbi:hypothetical protein QBC35DRAFT_441806 [Podospora australis]|uniref:FAD-binding PCMH-type domain-containing protein n=1 Tax=Podospora australis TaxID=1536484 RepID=A0AAN6WLB4_9PEZI|nr:hypothetical protein QBC35DRAFT_441806 [Podospora australis]
MRPLISITFILFSHVLRSLALRPNEAQLELSPAAAFPSRPQPQPRCKSFPGDSSWPSPADWNSLNQTLGDVLLNRLPPAAVCYPSSPNFNQEACNFLLNNATRTTFYFDDPITVQAQWPQGLTCPLSRNIGANATCTQGGFPVYVVNATTPRHVQAAVNFARNKNIRLIIKNTGHDSSGRNIGAGSLSVWTHYLKGFEFYPDYKQPGPGGGYRGPAAWVGAGLQVWEAFEQAVRYNITLPAASCLTVGSYGGWIGGGGHSPLSSKYGLGVDQVLELKVVTADGRYLTANPGENGDLFFALRGGGPIITSAIVKAHPPINLTIASFNFNLGTSPSTPIPSPNPTIVNSTAFWAGFNAVFAFGITTVDAGGYLWTNALPSGPGFSMQVRVQLPGFSPSEALTFLQPLISQLNVLGIPVGNLTQPTTELYSAQTASRGGGSSPGGYFASRLFPRKAYTDPSLFAAAMSAARATVEAGYTFHGLNLSPTLQAAGNPRQKPGVNPVWRDAVMHADVFGFGNINLGTASDQEVAAAVERLHALMEPLKQATPGGGAYVNEADPVEPDWQRSFYGGNYGRLREIKERRDPWGVFWAPTTPGSEGWRVEGTGGVLWRQNGRLCRT